MSFDWHQLHATEHAAPSVVDPRRRLRICLAGFVLLLLLVFGRMVQLEVSHGAAFRSEAARPLVRRKSVPGVRGRILARNGTVLAYDKKILALAVHYRYLEEPPNPRWLRLAARRRLSSQDRKNPRLVAEEEAHVCRERIELARRLTELTGISADVWSRRAGQIQSRVERIARSVNRRRRSAFESPAADANFAPDTGTQSERSYAARIRSFVLDMLEASVDDSPPERITVAEELDYHVIVEDVSMAMAVRIEGNPERYPGVRIVQRRRRVYPDGPTAAHLLGHLGFVSPDELADQSDEPTYHPEDRLGRAGLERQYEELLRGRRGTAVEMIDRGGHLLTSYRETEPAVGRDLILTLDVPLQRAAEKLLVSALERRALGGAGTEPAGGAIVVMDVQNGAVLAAASAPGFDPNQFAAPEAAEIAALFSDPAHPMFNRVSQMAIPAGSVFKIVSSAALLEAGAVSPGEPFFCRGYLHSPDSRRCAIFRRRGVGHGDVTLSDAICESCNVYFFHHAGRLGGDALVDWAFAFGLARPTGVDLPGESAGMVPTPATIQALEGHPWRTADSESLAIGQGSLEVTPLQVVCMMAAVANGGRLVTPHLVSGLGLPELSDDLATADFSAIADDPIHVRPPRPIPGLEPSTLVAIREGLDRVVSDPNGSAHGTVFLDTIAVAAKTGTAQTGPDQTDHAWLTGYVPAEEPKLAFVVVLEHAGDAALAAGPVAKRLVLRMEELGYFAPISQTRVERPAREAPQ